MRTPPASFFIKKALKLQSGSKAPGRDVAGQITMAQCRDIAKLKMKDLNTENLDQATKTIAGSARSMGIKVVE
jgi:large subunit ribosomal protein L11